MKRGERITNSILEGGLKLSALLAIFLIFLIFIFIFKEALPIFTNPGVRSEVDLRDLFASSVWQPVSDHPRFSLLPLFLGTLKLSLIAILFATPLALGAAIFTAEFAPRALKETIKPGIEILAGIPSVVMGAFALLTLASVLQGIFGWTMRLNAVNAGIALGLAIVPTIYSVADDALRAVPGSFREAAYALGSRRNQAIFRVIIPVALPGIFAGFMLGLGRAIGETMIVLLASGNAAILSLDPALSTRSFSATIAAELGEVVFGSTHYAVLFFIGALLFVITFIINLIANLVVERFKVRLAGVA
ncbi:MAG: phosphate ABC transporter permease subunit PstC [Proteobacteria bacterium]|nr:phosphate ABC transporter permease subunit PstC [Pseudomonadota bacterium]